MKYLKGLVIVLLVVSLLGAEIKQKYEPQRHLWGDQRYIYFDETHKVYVNNNPMRERWQAEGIEVKDMWMDIYATKHNRESESIPAKKKIIIIFKLEKLYKPQSFYLQAILFANTQRLSKRRVVLINVEQVPDFEPQYRNYLHLGQLYVGTIAKQEGWETILWDELIQGHADLEKLIEPGDIVGLSLVVTGIERGVELAKQAKRLGACCVIAGNDSAIFRANQLLRLPNKPIDAVCTSNSLDAIRTFFRKFNGSNLERLGIPDIATQPQVLQHSNEHHQMLAELTARKNTKQKDGFDPSDVFIVPDFMLYPQNVWDQVWSNYRVTYGHKHPDPQKVRNAIGLLAQGCTRTQGTDACSYCTIFGVGDIRIPSVQYLSETLDAYRKFGINAFYNATDSAFEMQPLLTRLEYINASFESLTIYGRAQGLALYPKLLNRWLSFVKDRLLINCGMDSGDNQILSQGVVKSSLKTGSRLEENRTAIEVIRNSGAHMHYSLVFGSPGESIESCERTLEFVQWSADRLGSQLDIVETDYYWLNFGAPASKVFRDYDYAQQLAAYAGKSISKEDWHKDFVRYSEELVVPWKVEEAWYKHFTNIDTDIAQEYNRRTSELLKLRECTVSGRGFNPIGKRENA